MKNSSELIVVSPNGVFTGVQFHDSICLYRNDALFYQKKADRRRLGHLVYTSSAGTLLFRSEDTLRRIVAGDSSTVETIGRLQREEGGTVTQLCTNHAAQRIFFSKTWTEEVGNFLGFLGGKKVVHKIGLFDWITGSTEQTLFIEEELSPEQVERFRWGASQDLAYVVTCTPKRDNYEIIVLNYIDEMTLGKLTFSWTRVDYAYVNQKGLVCLLQLDTNATKVVLWDYVQSSSVRQFKLPPGYALTSFNDDMIAFFHEGIHRWLVTDLHGKILIEVDTAPLHALTDSYQLLLGRGDTIRIVSFKEGDLKVNSSDIRNIEVDSKRWAKLEEQMKLDEQDAKRRREENQGVQSRIGTMSEKLSAKVESLQSGELTVPTAGRTPQHAISDPQSESGSRWTQLKDELSRPGQVDPPGESSRPPRLSIPIASDEGGSVSLEPQVKLPSSLADRIPNAGGDSIDFLAEDDDDDAVSVPDKIDL